MGIWTKGGKIDCMAILAKTQKWYEGKSERGEGVATTPHPSWERGLIHWYKVNHEIFSMSNNLLGPNNSETFV